MFHDILPETLKAFESNLRFLREKTNVVCLKDYFLGKLSSKKINTVITFDDGYKSWITQALPVLLNMKLPAIFFVSSGFIGLSKNEQIEFLQTRLMRGNGGRITGCLDYDDLKLISKNGFTIGGHTLTHGNLADFKNRTEMANEIRRDKQNLEQISGSKVEYFSYPFGSFDNKKIDITEVLRGAGYKGGVTAISGFNTIDTNPFLLHREITSSGMAGPIFRARVYGNYDAVQCLKDWLRRNFERQWV